MKKHIKLKGTNYYLCGLKQFEVEPALDVKETDVCMQCSFMSGGFLGTQDVSKFKKTLNKFKRRSV